MRQKRRSYRNIAPQDRPASGFNVRLGPDFAVALVLLIFGCLLPLVASIQNRPVLDQQLATGSSAVPALPTLQAVLPAQESSAIATPTQHIAPSMQPEAAAVPDIPTLIPIVPTASPASLPTAVANPPARPAAQGATAGQSRSGPILMYHYVRTVDEASDPLGYGLSVTPELFEQHMAWLAQNGYTGVSLDTWLRCTGRLAATAHIQCPAAAVALTFDDGYNDAVSVVLPVLQRYSFTATFYIVSGFVGKAQYMSWSDIAQLRDAGMEIGAHSVTHLNLTRLALEGMRAEIAQSKADIEQQLGIPVLSFCYPSGDYDGIVEQQVREAGFTSAVTTRWDSHDADLLTLPRRRVAGGTAPESFGWIVTS